MKSKYQIYLDVLDQLAKEAPTSYQLYHKNSSDDLILKRSLCNIHLFLKVKFGMSDFLDRHSCITDGGQDGGIDAYYIDSENKKLYLIQSKYRDNEKNFHEKSISADELVSMDIARITKGHEIDDKNVEYNSKIKTLQSKLRNIRDIAKYDYVVIILANVKYIDAQIRRLIDNCDYEIYNYDRIYSDLIFPLASGTYFDPQEIKIRINLSEKDHPKLKQKIETDFGHYIVTVIFVPCDEIGKILAKYKNSVLKYNPRNYLSLMKNSVNEKIQKSITSSQRNNFAILNNGITILADNLEISESTGELNTGQIILTQPQILNGGQTAYTLSEIYSTYKDQDISILSKKEVMVKIITRIKNDSEVNPEFIQMISNATNQQSEVIEADRRSNHTIQLKLQSEIFSNYGYFYERKNGEFYEGLKKGIIQQNLIINRLDFIKAVCAYKGEPAAARRSSEKNLFKESKFVEILASELSTKEMFFAYYLFYTLIEKEKSFKKKNQSIESYGYSLMYGKWAVIYSIRLLDLEIPNTFNELHDLAIKSIEKKLNEWINFDNWIREKESNSTYFSSKKANFDLYYKVNPLDTDIREYFRQSR